MAVTIERKVWNLPTVRDGQPRGSISEAKDYLRCGLCFEEKYIKRTPTPLSHNLLLGGFAHNALHVARLRVRDSKVGWNLEEALTLAQQALHSSAKGIRTDILRYDDDTIGISEWEPDESPELDLGNYGSLTDLENFGVSLVKGTLPRIIEAEAKVGIRHVEEYIDFTDCFPFAFTGKLDCQLNDGTIRDVKTAGRNDIPGDDTAMQLATYVMPWWVVGDPIPLTETVVVVKNKNFDVAYHPYQMTPVEIEAVRDEILKVYAAISAGIFIKGDGFFGRHDYRHSTPTYKVMG